MIPQFSDFDHYGDDEAQALEEWADALVETARRYEKALHAIASYDAGYDWYAQEIIDHATKALGDDTTDSRAE